MLDWPSQDFQCHGLPYVPLQSNQECLASYGPQSLPPQPANLAATPPMPLPMVDPPFPTAPPPTPVPMYPHGDNLGYDRGEDYTWTSYSSASLGSEIKPDPSSPFRFPHDNIDISTVSPQDLHSEMDYNHHFQSMLSLNSEDLGTFHFSDAEAPAPVPAYTRRPLPHAAPAVTVPSTRRKASVPMASAAGHYGSASNQPRCRPHGPCGSDNGSSSGHNFPLEAPTYIPGGALEATGVRQSLPSGRPMSTQTQFPVQHTSLPQSPPSNTVPSRNAMSEKPLAPTFKDEDLESVVNRESPKRTSTSSRSSRKKAEPKPPTKSSPLRKNTTNKISSHKQSSASVPARPHPSVAAVFPPGQNRPGFVSIGQIGVATVAQGNSHPLDLALKKRIIVAERDAGLTYKAIKNKYTRWREAESTYRGLDRTARLPVEHRERVASWSEQHVSTCLPCPHFSNPAFF